MRGIGLILILLSHVVMSICDSMSMTCNPSTVSIANGPATLVCTLNLDYALGRVRGYYTSASYDDGKQYWEPGKVNYNVPINNSYYISDELDITQLSVNITLTVPLYAPPGTYRVYGNSIPTLSDDSGTTTGTFWVADDNYDKAPPTLVSLYMPNVSSKNMSQAYVELAFLDDFSNISAISFKVITDSGDTVGSASWQTSDGSSKALALSFYPSSDGHHTNITLPITFNSNIPSKYYYMSISFSDPGHTVQLDQWYLSYLNLQYSVGVGDNLVEASASITCPSAPVLVQYGPVDVTCTVHVTFGLGVDMIIVGAVLRLTSPDFVTSVDGGMWTNSDSSIVSVTQNYTLHFKQFQPAGLYTVWLSAYDMTYVNLDASAFLNVTEGKDTKYYITNKQTGFVLTSNGTGNTVYMAPKSSNATKQLWTFVPGRGDPTTIVSVETGGVLDIKYGNPSAGAEVIVWPKKSSGYSVNQQWTYDTTTSTIKCAAGNVILDIKHASTAPNTPVLVYYPKTSGNANQQFAFIPSA